MSKSKERRDQISEIKYYKKFNIEITKNVEKLCRRIYIIYLTWFIIFDHNTTRIKITRFYHYNIKCITKIKEIQKQYLHYKIILKRWENKRVNVKHQITSRQQQNNKINEIIFKWI